MHLVARRLGREAFVEVLFHAIRGVAGNVLYGASRGLDVLGLQRDEVREGDGSVPLHRCVSNSVRESVGFWDVRLQSFGEGHRRRRRSTGGAARLLLWGANKVFHVSTASGTGTSTGTSTSSTLAATALTGTTATSLLGGPLVRATRPGGGLV